MSSVALTGTNHSEGEAVHLRVMRVVGAAADNTEKGEKGEKEEDADADVQETPARRRAHVHANVGTYAGLLQRACPAGVYEYVPDDGGKVVPGNVGVRARSYILFFSFFFITRSERANDNAGGRRGRRLGRDEACY
jgi:electron-transferring-flavoprotein dehydrogenase